MFRRLYNNQPLIPRLPKLREEVRACKTETDSQLSKLPARLAQAPPLELMKLITVYTDKLNDIAQGDKGDRELLRLCKPTYGNFRAAIRRTAPRFIPRQSQRPHFSTLETGSDEVSSTSGEYSDDSDDGGDHELRLKHQ